MKKFRLVWQHTKEAWSIGNALLQEKNRTSREKMELLFFVVFGGFVWTWITDGLAEEERKWHERSI